MLDFNSDFSSSTTVSSRMLGHAVTSVVAFDEPIRQRRAALGDLANALPDTSSLSDCGASISHVATTPDFHPGKPVPVGVVAETFGAVLPHMIGNDIGCGMRLMVIEGVTREDLDAAHALDRHLRHMLFQGGRDLALTGRMRRAILEAGLLGLFEELARASVPGLLANLEAETGLRELDRICDLGSLDAGGIDPDFADFAPLDDTPSRDAIFGTLGGGNHFLEFGHIDEIADGGFARVAGIKPDAVTLCIHTGSLDFGQRVYANVKDKLLERRASMQDHRILPLGEPISDRYLTGLANAGNAAFANRFFLGLAAIEAVRRATGKSVGASLVYDAPHNMAWQTGDRIIHRKGACPARAGADMAGSPYAFYGEPVILPGSMGDATWLLAGRGSEVTRSSSAHGAGRRLSRGEARRQTFDGHGESSLRIVGPLDLGAPELFGRSDILEAAKARIAEEAPGAYRSVENVVAPMVAAGLVGRVARIKPLLTAKG